MIIVENPGLTVYNKNLQPWVYLDKISKLVDKTLGGDEKIVIRAISLLDFLLEDPPDRTIGVLTSPIYTLKELASAGFRYPKLLELHYMWALLPGARYGFQGLITLSNTNLTRFKKKVKGIPSEIVIPPGIEPEWFLPNNPDLTQADLDLVSSDPQYFYYGGTHPLRGLGLLKNQKVTVLARDQYRGHENVVLRCNASVGLIKSLMGIHRATVLPFRLYQSDVPISLLESLAVGKPVISTDIGSIPEFIPNVVKPNTKSLDTFLELNKFKIPDPLGVPTWSEQMEKVSEYIKGIIH